jgi:hypothetical protein
MTCEATCPFTGCRAHSALMKDGGHWLILSSDPPNPTPSKFFKQYRDQLNVLYDWWGGQKGKSGEKRQVRSPFNHFC